MPAASAATFFFANVINNDSEDGSIGVAVAEHPQGWYRDLFGQPPVGIFHCGAQPIDQYVFEGDDGNQYMIFSGLKHANIVR